MCVRKKSNSRKLIFHSSDSFVEDDGSDNEDNDDEDDVFFDAVTGLKTSHTVKQVTEAQAVLLLIFGFKRGFSRVLLEFPKILIFSCVRGVCYEQNNEKQIKQYKLAIFNTTVYIMPMVNRIVILLLLLLCSNNVAHYACHSTIVMVYFKFKNLMRKSDFLLSGEK